MTIKRKSADDATVVSAKKYRTCEYGSCTKQAFFNVPGESTGRWCSGHGKEHGAVDFRQIACEEPGCTTNAHFNMPGETKGRWCAQHGKPKRAVDVKRNICDEAGCQITATFNMPGETTGVWCATHGRLHGAIDVKNKRCIEPDCPSVASHRMPEETTKKWCATHGKPKGAVFYMFNKKSMPVKSKSSDDVPAKKYRTCEYGSCTKQAVFNVPGESKGRWCAEHGKEHAAVS